MSSSIKLKNLENTELTITHSDGKSARTIVGSDIAVAVNTIADFPLAPQSGDTVIVRDTARGGTFVYDSTQSTVNNSGTIFNGWVRQYSGAVSVQWFGAKDGADNTVAIQNALNTGLDVMISLSESTISASLTIGNQRLFGIGTNGINRTQTVFNITGNFPAIINGINYISFEIEGIYFLYDSITPTDALLNSNKIAINITGAQSGEYYHIKNCTIRGAWIGYNDITGSWLSKLTQVACRNTRQGFVKIGGTTIYFDSCSAGDGGINGFVLRSILSSTLVNCAADSVNVTSDSAGSAANYFAYIYGLSIIGWDGEANIINNNSTSINYEVVPSYMRFHNTVGNVSSLTEYRNSLVSPYANSGCAFFFVGDNSVMTFTSCDIFKDDQFLDLTFTGTLSPVYSLRAVNSAKVTVIGCDLRAPTGGTPTTRFSVSGDYYAFISLINSQVDNSTSNININISNGITTATTAAIGTNTTQLATTEFVIKNTKVESLNATRWVGRTSAADNSWRDIAWNGTVFAAVSYDGTGNRVMTSPDGITWTSRTSAADNQWMAIAWNGTVFAAVSNTGTGNRVMTSPDGITWTSRTSAADNSWRDIAWNGTVFAAVSYDGTGNRVMTSPDGITWTSRTSAADNSWKAIAWNGTVFAAVSYDGTGNRVMTSPDGITWTSRTSAADNSWKAIAWNGTVFAAVANSGTGNRVMTSPDGITWTIRTSAADNSWMAIAWNGTVFAAVSDSGAGNRVMTSPDGITWTIRTSATDNNWISIAWNGTVFAAVAYTGTGNRVMTTI